MEFGQAIVHVTEYDFEYEVLSFSQNKPVVAEFWAPWSRHSLQLAPMLEKLTYEYQGALRLARINVDESPNLAIQFGVRSVPTLKAYTNAEVVAEMVNYQPEERVRAFFRSIGPSHQLNLELEKADALAALHEWGEAESLYTAILEDSPGQPQASLGYLKCLLAQDQPADAVSLIRKFPPSRQYLLAVKLQPLANTMLAHEQSSLPAESDADLTFARAIFLIRRGNILSAIDGLMGLVRAEPGYRKGLAKNVLLGLLDVWGDSAPETRQYRAELANILF